MALTFHSGFEMGDFSEWDSVTGSPAIESTIVKTGAYAGKFSATGSSVVAASNPLSSAKSGSIWFRFNAAPSGDATFLKVRDGTSLFRVWLTTERKVKIAASTGSTVLNVDTYYRISWYISGTTIYIEVNGSSEVNGARDTTTATTDMFVGVESGGITVDFYIDDVVIGDSTSTAEGDIRVELSQPNAVGNYNDFDNLVPSAIHYENVDNNPQDVNVDNDFNEIEATGAFKDSYNIENSSTIGLGGSDTVEAVSTWARLLRNGGGGTDHMILVRDNGSDYLTADLALTTSFAWFNKYDADLPNGGGAWTQARFDAFEVGVYRSTAQDMTVSNMFVMVAYTPTVGGINYPISLSAGLNASSTIAYAVAWDRGILPGLVVSATIVRNLTYNRAMAQGLTLAVTIVKAFGRLITTTANLTASATIARILTYTRAISSNLTATVTILKGWGRKITTVAGLIVSATVVVQKGWKIALSSGLTISATIAKSFGRKVAVTSNLTVSATVAYLIAYKRAIQAGLTTAVTIVAVWGRLITTVANLTVNSVVARFMTYTRATTSNLTASVTILKGWGREIATNTALTIITTITRTAAYKRAITSNLAIAITVLKGWGRTKVTTADLIITVSIIKSLGRAIITSPGLTISATIVKGWGRAIAITTNLTIAVSVVKSWGRTVATNTALAVSATISRTLAYVRATAAGLTVSVTIIATFISGAITEYFITVTTNLTASVTISRVLAYARATSVAIGIATTVEYFWKYIQLTLLPRIFGFTLKSRTVNLTLKPRSLSLTLQPRTLNLTLKPRSLNLTLRKR